MPLDATTDIGNLTHLALTYIVNEALDDDSYRRLHRIDGIR
jgi:hypothetical protein